MEERREPSMKTYVSEFIVFCKKIGGTPVHVTEKTIECSFPTERLLHYFQYPERESDQFTIEINPLDSEEKIAFETKGREPMVVFSNVEIQGQDDPLYTLYVVKARKIAFTRQPNGYITIWFSR